VRTPVRNAVLRSHKNHRTPGSWVRAAIGSILTGLFNSARGSFTELLAELLSN
jgi:hypothetical protein